MRWSIALASGVLLLAGCSGETSSGGGNPDCESHYDEIAHAASRKAVGAALLTEVPRARSLRVQGTSDDDHTILDVLDRRGRRILQLEVWQEPDGTWTASQWSQCID